MFVIATDYAFEAPDQIEGGVVKIELRNDGPAEDVRAWYDKGRKGAPPGRRFGGMVALSPGRHAYFTADFEPGCYAFFCMVNDVGDGRTHIFHEMILELTMPT